MRYISRFFSKHKVIYTILIILLCASCTFLGCVLNIGNDAKTVADEEEKKSEGISQMFMAEALDDVAFYSYMEEGTEEFSKFQKLYQNLQVEDSFSYVVQSDQFLEVKTPKISDIFLVGYEEGYSDSSVFESEDGVLYSTKTLQVSQSFFEQYNIRVQEGRLFSEEDYQLEDTKSIPIILGATYKDYFQLGDIIEANYLFEGFQFQVVGFLEPSMFYYSWNRNEMISCERYILMPAFYNLPDNEFGKRALLQYFTAYIESEESFEIIEKKILNLVNENELLEEYFNLVNPNEDIPYISIKEIYTAMTGAVAKYFEIIIGIMIVCNGCILTIVLTNMIQEENYNFGIYIMCGMKKRELAALIFQFDGFIVGIADIITILLLMGNQVTYKEILLVQAVMAFILVVSFIACYLRIRKMDISELIGGKE